MQAAPPSEAQVLPDTAEPVARTTPAVGPAARGPAAAPAPTPEPTHLRPAEPIQVGPQPDALPKGPAQAAEGRSSGMSGVDVAAATMVPRRPVIEDAKRSRTVVPWLGIASWLLLCGALFASLVGWPDQTALDRVTSIWSSDPPSATLARSPAQEEPTPAQGGLLPGDQQDWSAMTPGSAQEREALPPIELAPPIGSETPADTAEPAGEGPPLPRFKPSVDGVAAKFSNAFQEFGERLQQQGNFDAAVHMRRQGSNLSPWKSAGASDL